MQISREQFIDLAYEFAEIGVHAKNSDELHEQVIERIWAYESEKNEEFWNDKMAMGRKIN